ncbi:MAG: hypothetical protein ABJE95_24045 [Byssovorax sp.]
MKTASAEKLKARQLTWLCTDLKSMLAGTNAARIRKMKYAGRPSGTGENSFL